MTGVVQTTPGGQERLGLGSVQRYLLGECFQISGHPPAQATKAGGCRGESFHRVDQPVSAEEKQSGEQHAACLHTGSHRWGNAGRG